MTKAEEAAKVIYKDGIELFGRRDKSGNLIIHPEIMVGILRNAAARGYEQAEKDLAQDFHADTLIGDKDYAVFHADVEDLNGDLYNYCQEQGFMGEVKVIIVEDPGAVEIS